MEQYSCKGCDKRKPGCHSTCEDYLARSKKWADEREEIRKIKDRENAYIEIKHGLKRNR